MDLRSGPQFDVGRPFTFLFADPAWVRKALAGGAMTALACTGIGLPVLMGWLGRLFREVVQDDAPLLPAWSPLRDFRAGILPTVIVAAWLLPPFVLVRLGWAGPLAGELWHGVAGVLLPAALTRVWVGLRAEEALDPVEILLYVRDNSSNYVLLLVLWISAAFLGVLGIVALVGVFVTLFWGALAAVHALAQVYRLSRLHSTPAIAASGDPAPAAVA